MTRALSHRDRFIRRATRSLKEWSRNAPLFILTGAVALSVEVFAAAGIFAVNTEVVTVGPFQVRLAYAEAVMSVSMTLVSLILAGAAAAQKADPRPAQQRRAWRSQTLAIFVLAAPIYYASSCIALNAQMNEWRGFNGSAVMRADQAIIADPMGDVMAKREAASDLERAIRPTHADGFHLVPALMWVSFLLFSNMIAVRVGWRAKPAAKRAKRSRRTTSNVVQLKTA